MNRLFSWRPFALLLLADGVLASAAPAQAGQRTHVSRGTAQFVNANDLIGDGSANHLGRYTDSGRVDFLPTADPTVLELHAS